MSWPSDAIVGEGGIAITGPMMGRMIVGLSYLPVCASQRCPIIPADLNEDIDISALCCWIYRSCASTGRTTERRPAPVYAMVR